MNTFSLHFIQSAIIFFIVLSLMMGIGVFTAHAETVVRVSEEVRVLPDQKVDGDFYAAGNSIIVTGEVHGDMLSVADTITINGPVSADVLAAARSITLSEPVGDDVRIVAAEVTLGSDIAGDVFVAAGTLTVLPTAQIAGNVYIFGASATVDGAIAGSVYGSLERLAVNGSVDGDVDVSVPAGLVLGDTAVVGGDVRYKSSIDVSRGQNTEVGGTITEKSPTLPTDKDRLRALFVPLFIILFGTLSTYLLARPFLHVVASGAAERPVVSLAIGVAVLLLALPVVTVLVVSVIGAVMGVVFLVITLFAYAMAVLGAGTVLALYVQRLRGTGDALSVVLVFGGTVAWYGLFFIPVVGPIVAVTLVLMTLGAQCQLLVQKLGVK